jgi:hypothetical protein
MLVGVYAVLAVWATHIAGLSPRPLSARAIFRKPSGMIPRFLVSVALLAISFSQILHAPPYFIIIPIGFHWIVFCTDFYFESKRVSPKFRRGCACFAISYVAVGIDFQGRWQQAEFEKNLADLDYFSYSFILYPFFDAPIDFSLWILGWAIFILF